MEIKKKAKKRLIYLFTRLVIIIVLFLIFVAWKPILIFGIPGILILFLPIFKKINIVEALLYIVGISMCFWICSFWFLKILPLELKVLFLLVTFFTMAIALYFLCKKKYYYEITTSFYDFVLLGLFLYILFLRLLPIFYSIAAAGADMSMHTYMTDLIVKANGIPKGYFPILEINSFDSFPVGFHTISALIALLGNMPAFKSAFITSCLAYAFVTMFLCLFLMRFMSWKFAFISSVYFTFFIRGIQGTVGWGGNPLILALALFILFLSFVIRYEMRNKWIILLSAMFLAAVLLTHINIFLPSVYIFAPSFLIYLFLNKENKKSNWSRYSWFLVVFLAISMPYLCNVDFSIMTPYAVEWIRSWVNQPSEGFVWHGTAANFIWAIPIYIVRSLGLTYWGWLAVLGVIFLFYKNTKTAIVYIASLIAAILLILNTKYWILPFSYSLYPERIAMMAIIPISLFFGYVFEHMRSLFNRKYFYLSIVLIVTICILMANYNKKYYLDTILDRTSITDADMKAFEWLKNHTSYTEAIKNNYGDAGLWIPAIISRPITSPHVNVIYLDKIKEPVKPKYVYIGKKEVYLSLPFKNSDFKNNSKYKQVYDKDGVNIYEILYAEAVP